MATKTHFEIDQGTNVQMRLELVENDGSPKDMTNHLVFAQMKQSYLHDSDQATKFNCIVTDASNGVVDMYLTNVQTDALDARRKYLFDIEVKPTTFTEMQSI